MNSSIDSFWDLAYASGDHLQHWQSPFPPPELAVLVAAGVIAADATVLDIGCGAGADAIFLARLGLRVIGVDSSARAIELAEQEARTAGVAVAFHHASVSDLPLAETSVDFAYDRGCLHVIDEERAAYAREVSRVLRPGGTLLISGARVDDEEEGVIAINEEQLDRYFLPVGFERGPLVPLELVSQSGRLAAHLAVLRLRPS